MKSPRARLTNISNSIEAALPGAPAPGDDIAFLTATELCELYRRRMLSPVEVARALLDRIDHFAVLNTFVHLDPQATLAMAVAAESRWRSGEPLGPLDGVPATIKDLLAVAGWPLTRGSPALVGDPAPGEDAPAVARLREAGAVFLGKTATPDAGSQIVTRSLVHGVTLNPYDLSRTPGGSSGGAAAALAAGLGPIAIGTDGAGSIRIPAAWTGVFGLKPSFGRVPAFPPSLFAPHSVSGPMARCVSDATALLLVLSRPEPRDPFAMTTAFDAAAAATGALGGLRVGVTADFGVATPPIDADAAAAVRSAANVLAAAGADVREVAPAWPCPPLDPFRVLWEATYAGFLDTSYSPQKAARMDPHLLAIAARGRGIGMASYHRALAQRGALTAAARRLFLEIDLLVGPVMPCPAPLAAEDAPEGCTPGDWAWCPFTYLWNMTGQPAASAPMGLDRAGLPVGVQLVGWMGQEAKVLAAASALEAATPLSRPPGL
jgi:aspartyl-tRNA(Asn)/glutamyl-tRNA(Gln) amidotransferase subunit A